MKKVLVTGAAGYIGSALCYQLIEAGYSVTGVDKLLFGGNPIFGLRKNKLFNFIHADINDTDKYKDFIDSDTTVIHLAAIVGEPACNKFLDEARRTNIVGTKKIISLSLKNKAEKFIFASTCSNYGVVREGDAATEETKLNPLGFYAESKVEMEKYIQSVFGDEINWTILRFSTVQGLSPRPRFDLTVNDFTVNGYMDKKLVIFLPKTTRPYAHVYDIAAAIIMAAEQSDLSRSQIYNVGNNEENHRKIEIADKVCETIGDIEIEFVERGEDLRDYKVCFDKIKNHLGFETKYTMEDGVKEIFNAVSSGEINDYKNRNYYND